MIPSEAFDVTEVRPLSLQDLALRDTVELDIKTIAMAIQQEMTRALIISPKWYLQLNFWSLMDYDLGSVSNILLAGADRGYVNGDEWRDRMHMAPAGLKEYKVLENYIPYEDSGKQKKLIQDE